MAHGILTPCNVAGGCGITCHWIRSNVRHIWILLLVYTLAISRAVDMSFCTSLRNFIQMGPPSAEKNWRHIDFQAAIFDFMGPIMGSLKSPCTTASRSSIETIALNCLVFWENRVFCILATHRQTNRQTNRWTGPLHEAALAVASGGLTIT